MPKGIGGSAPLLSASVGSTGLALGVASVFSMWVVPWSTEFHVARAPIMLIMAITTGASILFAPLVGRAMTRIAPWRVMFAGCAIMGVTLLALLVASQFWQVAVLYTLGVGSGMLLCGPLPSQTLAIRRLPDHAGAVGGLTMMGISVGSTLMPLLLGFTASQAGWRAALALAGAAVLFGGCALLWAFGRDHGLPTSSNSATPQAVTPPATVSTKRILFDRRFWLTILSVLPVIAVTAAVQANLIALLIDRGVDTANANYVMAAYPAASATGSLVAGLLGDKFGPRNVLLALAAIVSIMLVALGAHLGFGADVVALVVLGFAAGSSTPILTTLVVRGFGYQSFAPVMGLITPFLLPVALSPAVFGWARDAWGSYDAVILGSIPVLVLGVLAILLLSLSSVEEARAGGLQLTQDRPAL